MVTEQVKNPPGPLRLTVEQNLNSTPKGSITEIRKIVTLTTINAVQVCGNVHQLRPVFHKVCVDDLLLRLGICFRIHADCVWQGICFQTREDCDVGRVMERF